MTVSAVTIFIVDIAGVSVADAVFQGDVAGAREGGGWRTRNVSHFVVGVESGEVHGHIGAEFIGHPAGHVF